MSATDYGCDFWNTNGTHPYFQQRMMQVQPYYREPAGFEGHPQENHGDLYFNGYTYPNMKSEQQPQPDVSSLPSTHFPYESYPACRQEVVTKDDSPTLRALLTKQKKQQDCNYFNVEEHKESSCDYNKMDLLLSPSSERSSETDRESEPTKASLEQPPAQFYPWMKAHHGKPINYSIQ